jgi:hypothetical protein
MGVLNSDGRDPTMYPNGDLRPQYVPPPLHPPPIALPPPLHRPPDVPVCRAPDVGGGFGRPAQMAGGDGMLPPPPQGGGVQGALSHYVLGRRGTASRRLDRRS